MDLHRTFPISNLTPGPRLVFTDLLSLLGVTFTVFFLILLSLKKKKVATPKPFLKMVFQKYTKNEDRYAS